MPDHGIVVVGASAGGVEALTDLAGSLPEDLSAAVFVVLHLPATGTSALPEILRRHGPLPAAHVKDGEPIEPGRIYVAPPDHHVLLRTGHVHLSHGPRENGHRPAIDPLFRSAAREYATRVIGLVLSGTLDDGTAGLLAIKSRGGVAVVQDPDDALYTGMPGNALEHVQVDHVAIAASMGKLLARLLANLAEPPAGPAPGDMQVEVEKERFSLEAVEADHPGRPSGFSCPDCNGVLWQIQDGGLQRYRCRVGHGWSPESLLTRQREALEGALWVALRSLEERAALARRLAEPARGPAGTGSRPPALRSRRPRPSRRPGWSGSCWWTGTPSSASGRWPATAPGRWPLGPGRGPVAEPPADRDLEVLLDYLRRSRGFDFTGYKRASLSRRIDKRIQVVGADGYLGYLDHLEVDPEEFAQLFNTILLNVTGFFRDPAAWDYLAGEVLPLLLADKGEDEPVRIWSAGCASGEEAYTLAMVAAEALGPEGVRERVKIYATDLDEEALSQARQARYTAKRVEGVPPELLERWFEPNGQGHVFSKELRRSVIFGRHDLIQDAPISRIDLLVCRNTLMYLNSETQSHVLARFSFALREGGYLMLGKAEMLLAHADLFTAVDLKRRVFRKVPGATLGERLMVLTEGGERPAGSQLALKERIHRAALETSPEAQIVVDAGGYLTLANARARTIFRLSVDDLARPFQDLELSYRPLELRSKIQQAYLQRHPSPIDEVEWPTPSGEVAHLQVQVVPLIDEHQVLLGASISFTDVTRSRHYKQELEHANQGLEDAYAELQSTNEELETTNEELQSTVEELETTNEELQSTNEELETMNEEMQATNEELQTINDELGLRTAELNQLNAFLESIWAGLDGAVTVLDPDLRVLVWNHGSEELWGVRQEEVQGQHFLNLDIGLPVDQLRPTLQAAMGTDNGTRTTMIQATNRRGRTVTCRVTCTPLLDNDKTLRGVIVVVVDDPGQQGPTG